MANQPNDDLAIPDFLVRTAENTPKVRFGANPWKWQMTQAMQTQIDKDKIKTEKAAACEPVLLAVLDGQTTVGKIKKATGLETALVQQALRALIKRRAVAKLGRQYLPY